MLKLFPKKEIRNKTTFNHTARKDVVEAIAEAMETADRMRHVIILYETIESDESSGGIISDDEITLSKTNYLLDMGKKWIFS